MYGMLSAHHEVCTSDIKETMYFDRYFERGSDWYENRFNKDEMHKAVCEVSDSYLTTPNTCERIKSYNPDAKIVVATRNPIERAVSHYLFMARNGVDMPRFSEAIRDGRYRKLLGAGVYYQHMKPFLDRFAHDRIKVMFLEDLRRDPESYSCELLQFIGVESQIPEIKEGKYTLSASAPRSQRIARMIKKGANAARDLGMERAVQYVKDSGVRRLLYRSLDRDEKPTVSDDLRYELIDYYSSDIAKLSEFTQRDLMGLWFGK